MERSNSSENPSRGPQNQNQQSTGNTGTSRDTSQPGREEQVVNQQDQNQTTNSDQDQTTNRSNQGGMGGSDTVESGTSGRGSNMNDSQENMSSRSNPNASRGRGEDQIEDGLGYEGRTQSGS